jgi:hypothetical protein
MRSIVRHDGVRVVLSAQPVGHSYVRICWGSAQQNVQQFVQQKLSRAFESIVFADKFIALERFTRASEGNRAPRPTKVASGQRERASEKQQRSAFAGPFCFTRCFPIGGEQARWKHHCRRAFRNSALLIRGKPASTGRSRVPTRWPSGADSRPTRKSFEAISIRPLRARPTTIGGIRVAPRSSSRQRTVAPCC